MTVHSLHIFDRKGKTLFTKRYSAAALQSLPPSQAQPSPEQAGNEALTEEEQLAEQRKLVFGMLFSLRELLGSLAPEGEKSALQSVRTGACTLHSYETRSGLRFAMYTNNDVGSSSPSSSNSSSGKSSSSSKKEKSVQDALKYVYSELWVEYVVRSPLYRAGELDGDAQGSSSGDGEGSGGGGRLFQIQSTNFEKKLDAYLTSMPWFR